MELRMNQEYWADVKKALKWPDTAAASDVEMVHRMVQEIDKLSKANNRLKREMAKEDSNCR